MMAIWTHQGDLDNRKKGPIWPKPDVATFYKRRIILISGSLIRYIEYRSEIQKTKK